MCVIICCFFSLNYNTRGSLLQYYISYNFICMIPVLHTCVCLYSYLLLIPAYHLHWYFIYTSMDFHIYSPKKKISEGLSREPEYLIGTLRYITTSLIYNLSYMPINIWPYTAHIFDLSGFIDIPVTLSLCRGSSFLKALNRLSRLFRLACCLLCCFL